MLYFLSTLTCTACTHREFKHSLIYMKVLTVVVTVDHANAGISLSLVSLWVHVTLVFRKEKYITPISPNTEKFEQS